MNSDSRKNLPMRSASSESNNSNNNLINYPSNVYPEELLETAGGLDLREFITVLNRRKKLVILIALTAMVLAFILTLLMQPVYRADSTIKIERYAANANVEILNAAASRSDRDFFETQIQLIQTKDLARRVIDQLGLDKKASTVGLLSKIKGIFSSKPSSAQDDRMSMEDIFLENLTVKPIGNSQLLKISYDSSKPTLAANISNSIAKTFVRQNLERRFDTASSYKTYVSDNIDVTRMSLEGAEKRLNAYAKENGIVQSADGETTGSYTLKKQAEELVLARKERIEAEATYEIYKNDPSSDPSSIINNPYILSLKKASARLQTKYQSYRNKRSRAARNLKKEIGSLKTQIATEVESIKLSFKNTFLETQQKEKMLSLQMDKLKNTALNQQSKNTKYSRLLREVEINQLAYNKQLEQLMAVNVASNVGTNNISIIDRASPPTKKYKPSFKTNVLFGLLLGLLLGMGVAFLREFIDDSIKNSDLLEKISGLPVLSQFPEQKANSTKEIALQAAIKPRSALSEAIRSLRTSLRFSTRNGAPKSVFITSSAAGEGKTSIAVNLSIAYAQSGSKVLLIDADLRNPSIHKLLEVNNLEGLTNYLANPQATNSDISHSCMIKNLKVISSGPIPPDPVELLSGNKMTALLDVASNNYDYIIIDGPPVLGLADALVISNLSDATIVAVEAGKTRKTKLLDALKRLERANANLIGSVITRISRDVNPEYDQQYYSYEKPQKSSRIHSV